MDIEFKTHYDDLWTGFISVCIFMCLMDIIISLNTGLYYQGTIVRDRKIILAKYFRSHFAYDFLSLIPILIYATDLSGTRFFKLWNILIFLKIKSVNSSLQLIQGKNFFAGSLTKIKYSGGES